MKHPERFGRYEVIRLLGQGAMAYVYLCHDPLLEREVAIKVIRIPPWMTEEELETYRERFFREAKTAGKLQHPNIVTIHDMGVVEDTGVPFIVMEYVPGETLKQRIKAQTRLTPAESIHVILQVAQALSYAHENGVIHRDIKPANIIITPSNIIKLSDFGIAHITGSELTATGQFVGSPSYMSPEQAMGKQPTPQSDLFSLGIVFYECLTGEKPFKGETISQITFQLLNDTYPSVSNILPELPDEVVRIVQKLMERQPKQRYPSAEALIRDLEHCQIIFPDLRYSRTSLPEQTLVDHAHEPAYHQLRVAPEHTVDVTKLPLSLRIQRALFNFPLKLRDFIMSFFTKQPSPVFVNAVLLLFLILATIFILVRTGRQPTPPPQQGSDHPMEMMSEQSQEMSPHSISEQSGTVETYSPESGTEKRAAPPVLKEKEKKCSLRVFVKFPFDAVHIRIHTKDRTLYEGELRAYLKSVVGKLKGFPIKTLVREGVVRTHMPGGTEEVVVEIDKGKFGRRVRFPMKCNNTDSFSASIVISKKSGRYIVRSSWRKRS